MDVVTVVITVDGDIQVVAVVLSGVDVDVGVDDVVDLDVDCVGTVAFGVRWVVRVAKQNWRLMSML